MGKNSPKDLLAPYHFGNPITAKAVLDYLNEYNASSFSWYQNVSILDHIANVALFSLQIAQQVVSQGIRIDVDKVWLMGWLRDVGRIPWAIAIKNDYTKIIQQFGHHGYLGYHLLINSGVPKDLAIISMTHIGSGITEIEVDQINQILGRKVILKRNWVASTLEEKIIVIADKIPGWNNTVVKPFEANQRGESRGNKIYSWIENQNPLWERFWSFKYEVDQACGIDVLNLFNSDLLASKPRAYFSLPSPMEIACISPNYHDANFSPLS